MLVESGVVCHQPTFSYTIHISQRFLVSWHFSRVFNGVFSPTADGVEWSWGEFQLKINRCCWRFPSHPFGAEIGSPGRRRFPCHVSEDWPKEPPEDWLELVLLYAGPKIRWMFLEWWEFPLFVTKWRKKKVPKRSGSFWLGKRMKMNPSPMWTCFFFFKGDGSMDIWLKIFFLWWIISESSPKGEIWNLASTSS